MKSFLSVDASITLTQAPGVNRPLAKEGVSRNLPVNYIITHLA